MMDREIIQIMLLILLSCFAALWMLRMLVKLEVLDQFHKTNNRIDELEEKLKQLK